MANDADADGSGRGSSDKSRGPSDKKSAIGRGIFIAAAVAGILVLLFGENLVGRLFSALSSINSPTSSPTSSGPVSPSRASPSASDSSLPPSPTTSESETTSPSRPTPRQSSTAAVPPPKPSESPEDAVIQSVQIHLGDYLRGADNTYFIGDRRTLDFRYWWTTYTGEGELDDRCTVIATVYSLPDRTITHREPITSCSLNGWVRANLKPGMYRVTAKVTSPHSTSNKTGSATIRVQR
jgi:hypothetical protein